MKPTAFSLFFKQTPLKINNHDISESFLFPVPLNMESHTKLLLLAATFLLVSKGISLHLQENTPHYCDLAQVKHLSKHNNHIVASALTE